MICKENLKDMQLIAGQEFQRINAWLAQIPETLTNQRLHSSLQISSNGDVALLLILSIMYYVLYYT